MCQALLHNRESWNIRESKHISYLTHEDKGISAERETRTYWQTCTGFGNHLASLAEGDLLLSFPHVGWGLLLASGANGLSLNTKYENKLWFFRTSSVFSNNLGVF